MFKFCQLTLITKHLWIIDLLTWGHPLRSCPTVDFTKVDLFFVDISMYMTIIEPWVIQHDYNVSNARAVGGSFT